MMPNRSGHRLTLPALMILSVLASACQDEPSPSPSVDPAEDAAAVGALDHDAYVSLFEAAIQEVLDRRAEQGQRSVSRVVLDLPETIEAYRTERERNPDGPAGDHVRDAFGRLAERRQDLTWREGDRTVEITCEAIEGYPPRSCTMDEDLLLITVTPGQPQRGGRGQLENGDYEVVVWTRTQALHEWSNGARIMGISADTMVFRRLDGKWVLISHGIGTAV